MVPKTNTGMKAVSGWTTARPTRLNRSSAMLAGGGATAVAGSGTALIRRSSGGSGEQHAQRLVEVVLLLGHESDVPVSTSVVRVVAGPEVPRRHSSRIGRSRLPNGADRGWPASSEMPLLFTKRLGWL